MLVEIVRSPLFLAIFLFTILCPSPIRSQGSEFDALIGGFSVRLPQPTGSDGNGTVGGISYQWQQPVATYSLGYCELQGVPLARVNGDFSYEELIKRYFNKFSVDGERVYVKDTLLDGNPAKEYQYKTSKANFVLRVALVDDRVYELL